MWDSLDWVWLDWLKFELTGMDWHGLGWSGLDGVGSHVLSCVGKRWGRIGLERFGATLT